MSNNGVERIVIRHVSGSKANQVEQIPFDDLTEITIGRDPSSNIAFDSPRDDIASRRHAVIRVVRDDRISFRLADRGSSNGTFLNGERITEETELLPEDSIELGKNGLKFIFDVQPRPAYLVSRTRTIAVNDPATTRVIKAAEIGASPVAQDMVSNINVEPAHQEYEPPPKPSVGKETVIRMLGEERRATSRVWISSLAGVAAFAALGGGAFYWKHTRDLAELANQNRADLYAKAEEEQKERGLSPADIVQTFANATAQITAEWRLYDQATGKPVFHQTMGDSGVDGRGNKQSGVFPAYVRSGDLIVRWLTLEDDNRTNIAIGAAIVGTGFVVDERGFMLTNKHMTAAWKLAFGESDKANNYRYGWLYEFRGGPGAAKEDRDKRKPTLIDLDDPKYRFLRDWVPSSGGFVFMKDVARLAGQGNVPDASKGETHTFLGRNDMLEIRFANSRVSANAILANSSNESDAALIKVETPQQLKKVVIAADDDVKEGETVMAVGYPSVATKTVVVSSTIEAGQPRENSDIVPVPFVTTGIVSVISPAIKTENGVTMGGSLGDVIQMSINSTGPGNSGGPVFNKKGEVIGIFTYTIGNTTGAVPIKYGRDLMQQQHD